MIKFDEKLKVFYLENAQFEYAFYINEIGSLINLYYGKPIKDFTKDEIVNTVFVNGDAYCYYSLEEKKEHGLYYPFNSSICQPSEIPPYLCNDKKPPLIKIKHADGSSVTDFRYLSHEIVNGKPLIKGLPQLRVKDDECQTLIITLKDRKADILLKAYYTIFENKPVLARHNEIINNSKDPINLDKAASVCLDLSSNDYKLAYVHGVYPMDKALEEIECKHNTIVVDENAGGKGYHHNPVGMFKRDGSTADSGEVIGFGLLYSSNFAYSVTGTQLDQIRFVLGINEEDFSFLLNEGDNFETPEAILIYSSKGSDDVTLSFHDLVRDNLLTRTNRLPSDTILLNSWEGTFMDFNTEKIIKFIDRAKEMGVNLFVLDDGWFGKRDRDDSSLGDWYVYEDKIDLGKVVDHAHSLGMRFGLWIEPEMISPDSDLYRAHPEYALFDKTIDPTLCRHQFVIDMTNPEVVDYLWERIKTIFSTYKLDYCKWDFNRLITEPVSLALGKDRQGEVFHRFMLGTYELMDRFTKTFPNVAFESCSGGGGRYDLGILYYSPQVWASDDTDGISRTYVQYATNMYYPLRTIGAHVSARKYLSISEKAAIALFGTYGYELDPNKLSAENLEEVKRWNEIVLRNRDVVNLGDYYSLVNPFESKDFVSWEVVSKDKNRGLVFFMNYRLENWRARFVRIKGLDRNKYYKNSMDEKVYSGDYYSNVGLNFSAGRDNFTVSLVELEAVDGR